MVVAAEVRVARLNTLELINQDPRVVSLNRPVTTDDGAGGQVKAPDSSLPPQKVRIIPLSGLVWDRSNPTPDEGRTPDVTHQMIGKFDMDVKKDDWFTFSENNLPGRYIVTHVSPHRHWRTSAFLKYMEDEGARS